MRLLRWLKRLILLGALTYMATVAWVVYATGHAIEHFGDGRGLPQSTGAVLVLGSGIRGDGVLHYSSRRRVALGVKLLREGKAGHLIMSGNTARYYPAKAADFMAAYAEELGVSPEDISAETRAWTTFENLLYSRELAEAEGREIAVIASDATHVPRARALAWAVGLRDVGFAAVATPETAVQEAGPIPYLREAAAWWLNVGRVIAWRLNGRRWPL
ncbi:MAG: YdcF family protein [Pseudomonadota bacterium]